FPHHENEIAQSEGYTGKKPFVRYWMHNGLLQLGGEKMSKSIGNLVTIRDAVSEHGADALRLFVLTSHYRSPLTYTATSLDAAAKGVERMRAAITAAPAAEGSANAEATRSLAEATAKARLSFTVAMEDDFNTPAAIAALFDLVRDINRSREQGASEEATAQAQHTLAELARVLGFTLAEEHPQEEVAAQPFIELLLRVRRDLRAARQWALADKIRDELTGLGVMVEDRPEGSTWKLKK
ncbi:MAG: DALR domain-containing protein, partial [Chloroflexota bacterium]